MSYEVEVRVADRLSKGLSPGHAYIVLKENGNSTGSYGYHPNSKYAAGREHFRGDDGVPVDATVKDDDYGSYPEDKEISQSWDLDEDQYNALKDYLDSMVGETIPDAYDVEPPLDSDYVENCVTFIDRVLNEKVGIDPFAGDPWDPFSIAGSDIPGTDESWDEFHPYPPGGYPGDPYVGGDFEFEGLSDLYYGAAGSSFFRGSPIVLDLDQSGGIERVALDDSQAFFDLDNDGFREHAEWVSGEDGFLARDINGNGVIDDNSELFGDNDPEHANGWDKLREHDTNSDGIIDANDAISFLVYRRDYSHPVN